MAKPATRRRPPRTQTRRTRTPPAELSNRYWDVTHRPLPCLMFLLPLIVLYEVGMMVARGGPPSGDQPAGLAAVQILRWFFSLFGISSDYVGYLPGYLLIIVLLAWHVAARHPWRAAWRPTAAMAGESVLLSIPLLLLNEVIKDTGPLAAGTMMNGAFRNLVDGIGAGIYEELLFRLIIISLLNLLIIDIGGVREAAGVAAAVIISSLLFAAHHYEPVGQDVWAAGSFAFRAAAGAYLASVFVVRGFGLAVGCHIIYDIIAFAWG